MPRTGIVGMRGSVAIRLRPCIRSSTSLLSSTPLPPLFVTHPVTHPLVVTRAAIWPGSVYTPQQSKMIPFADPHVITHPCHPGEFALVSKRCPVVTLTPSLSPPPAAGCPCTVLITRGTLYSTALYEKGTPGANIFKNVKTLYHRSPLCVFMRVVRHNAVGRIKP